MNPQNALEQRLKAAKPTGGVPDGLHDAIIGAVRAAGEPQDVPSKARRGLRYATIAAVTAVLLVTAIKLSPTPGRLPPHADLPMTGVVPVLETSHALVEAAPAVVFNPLATELDLVNRDVRHAVEHLVASIP